MAKEDDDKINMTEDKKLIHEFVFDNAKEGINQTQQTIIRIDEKAYNMITISGVLMTIIGSVLIGGIDKTNLLNSIFLLLILIPLIICVHFAFKTVWLKDIEILGLEKINAVLCYTDYLKAIGNVCVSYSSWQKRLKKDIADPKSENLLISMKFFKSALWLILILAIIKIFQVLQYS